MERTGPPDASLGVRSKDFRLLELDRVRMIGSLCFLACSIPWVMPCQIGW